MAARGEHRENLGAGVTSSRSQIARTFKCNAGSIIPVADLLTDQIGNSLHKTGISNQSAPILSVR